MADGERYHAVQPQEIRELVAQAVANTHHAKRDNMSQAAMDVAIAAAYDEGELYLAAGMLLLMTLRARNAEGQALQLLMQLQVDLGRAKCRCNVCGLMGGPATDPAGFWHSIDLCSACAAKGVQR